MKKSNIILPITAILLVLVVFAVSFNSSKNDIKYSNMPTVNRPVNINNNNSNNSTNLNITNNSSKNIKQSAYSPNFNLKSAKSYSPISYNETRKVNSNNSSYFGNSSANFYGRSNNASRNNDSQILAYNQPVQININKNHNSEPFDDPTIQIGSSAAAPNYNNPNDPGYAPIGDAIFPMLIFAFGWIVYTRRKLK